MRGNNSLVASGDHHWCFTHSSVFAAFCLSWPVFKPFPTQGLQAQAAGWQHPGRLHGNGGTFEAIHVRPCRTASPLFRAAVRTSCMRSRCCASASRSSCSALTWRCSRSACQASSASWAAAGTGMGRAGTSSSLSGAAAAASCKTACSFGEAAPTMKADSWRMLDECSCKS